MPFHPTDVQVGDNIRELRILNGFSQEALGEALGLTFQQIQKYERGANRTSASRLYEMSKIFKVPISRFFKGLDDSHEAPLADAQTTRETLELVRSYHRISDENSRKKLFEMVKALAKADASAPAFGREGERVTSPAVYRHAHRNITA